MKFPINLMLDYLSRFCQFSIWDSFWTIIRRKSVEKLAIDKIWKKKVSSLKSHKNFIEFFKNVK